MFDQVDRNEFIEAMSRLAASVSVVSTNGPAGRFGLTVSAVTSVSADPPTLLICVNRKNPIAEAIRANERFAVNVLRADQRALAETFSGHPSRGEAYDFSLSRWEVGPHDIPLASGSVAWFLCELADEHHAGTHSIFLGGVERVGAGSGFPLVYGQRSFGELLHLPEPVAARRNAPLPVWDEPDDEGWPE